MKPSKTIWKGLAAALVVAGIAAPAAQGRPVGGGFTTGAYGAPAPIGLAPQTSGSDQQNLSVGHSYTTGAYGAPRTIGLAPQTSGSDQQNLSVGHSYTTGAYGAPRTIGLAPKTSGGTGSDVSQIATASGDSFDWTDAGIGAATAVGISVLLVGGLLIARRHQTRVAL
jgi:hypothetical protein